MPPPSASAFSLRVFQREQMLVGEYWLTSGVKLIVIKLLSFQPTYGRHQFGAKVIFPVEEEAWEMSPICVALLESCEAQAMKILENLVTALRRLMHRMTLGRLR
ncbi:hypothetical protein BI292_24620 [Pseudomonas sp. 43NM1]|nr:hypothetical protein BI292_24620 [Pseudomonas sp. 43NM1]